MIDTQKSRIEECAGFTLDYIKENPGCTGFDVTEEIRLLYIKSDEPDPKIDGVRKALEKLVQEGKIMEDVGTKHTTYSPV